MRNKTGNVLIAAPVHSVLTEGLAALGYTCVIRENITQAIAFEAIKDCVGVITSTRLQLDKELLDASPGLQWIGRMGSGMEVINVTYAEGKGIRCFSSPEGNCNAVGEHALGMLLALIRRMVWSHNEVSVGTWKREENRGAELEGKTVGIIGFGHTGRSFAKKLMGFDTRTLVYDKYKQQDVPSYVTSCDSLDTIFKEADIISFHVPLQPDTIHYLNKDFIASMKRPFILINTSRGSVVDTLALQKGMLSGKITGSCLDVFEHEPLSAMEPGLRVAINELARQPNVVLTPHIAGYTHEALYKMSKVLFDKVSAEVME
jgi:D-3-phosphoglycerate dehydrogenase / 2-oxoglutarate reductase